jgi:hypothetical protein
MCMTPGHRRIARQILADVGGLQRAFALHKRDHVSGQQDLDDMHEVHAEIPHQVEQRDFRQRARAVHTTGLAWVFLGVPVQRGLGGHSSSRDDAGVGAHRRRQPLLGLPPHARSPAGMPRIRESTRTPVVVPSHPIAPRKRDGAPVAWAATTMRHAGCLAQARVVTHPIKHKPRLKPVITGLFDTYGYNRF